MKITARQLESFANIVSTNYGEELLEFLASRLSTRMANIYDPSLNNRQADLIAGRIAELSELLLILKSAREKLEEMRKIEANRGSILPTKIL